MTVQWHSLMPKADNAARLVGEGSPGAGYADLQTSAVPAGTPPRW